MTTACNALRTTSIFRFSTYTNKCIVLGITLEKLNEPGYGTNVHIFILGSRNILSVTNINILSFTNISLSMWEEL